MAPAEGRVAPPGKEFAYASTNYILLGMVIERATATSLGRELRRLFRRSYAKIVPLSPSGAKILRRTGALLGTVSAVWSSPDGSRRRVVAMSNSGPLSPSAGVALKQLLNESFCG